MDFKAMSLVQLRMTAKEHGIKGISTLKKKELIEVLEQAFGDSKEKQDKEQIRQADAARSGENKTEQQTKGRVEQLENETKGQTAQGQLERKMQQQTKRQTEQQISYETEGRTEQRTGKREEGRLKNSGMYSSNLSHAHTANQTQGLKERNASSNYNSNHLQSNSNNINFNDISSLDSGEMANGILEVLPDGYGFIRCANYLPGENDVYVSPAQIRRFNLKTGDILCGNIRIKTQGEKFSALLFVSTVNGHKPSDAQRRKNFEDLTPIFPNERIRLETEHASVPMRMVDLLSPIGKGQRGMIVSPPKTGKTTLLKQIAKSISRTYKDMHLIVLLIDERPEEVTDIRESIEGENVEVIYSTFDELPEHHKRVSEMVLERAKRLVEHKEDVVILLDSITRLARAYNLTVPPSGRTLTGGLDPAALHMPKRFFGAARNMREGGSLTILATALVDTGSKMDDVVFEEFKGTGNMELVLDRKLSEKRIFPAVDIQKSGTRRDDLLLSKEEQEVVYAIHKEIAGNRSEESLEQVIDFFLRTKNNKEFIQIMQKSLVRR